MIKIDYDFHGERCPTCNNLLHVELHSERDEEALVAILRAQVQDVFDSNKVQLQLRDARNTFWLVLLASLIWQVVSVISKGEMNYFFTWAIFITLYGLQTIGIFLCGKWIIKKEAQTRLKAQIDQLVTPPKQA